MDHPRTMPSDDMQAIDDMIKRDAASQLEASLAACDLHAMELERHRRIVRAKRVELAQLDQFDPIVALPEDAPPTMVGSTPTVHGGVAG